VTNLGQGLVLGRQMVRWAVYAARDPLEPAGMVELKQKLCGPALRANVRRAQQPLVPREIEDALQGILSHEWNLLFALLVCKHCGLATHW